MVVLIDGDGAIFLPSLIAEGVEGGIKAGEILYTGIASNLDNRRFQHHVMVFLNKSGVIATLKRHGYSKSAAMFDEFIIGFNAALRRFCVIGVGESAAGDKIRGALFFSP